MKWTIGLFAILLYGCNNNHKSTTIEQEKLETAVETTHVIKEAKPETQLSKQYANDRFKEVSVEKIGDTKFRIQGKAQIFEANFNWVVEDGHDELKEGFEMTDAGAPEWGKFDFTIDMPKKRENSTLHLILFESSAKDGSRQFELPILLY